MASAMTSPISSSPAEIVATRAIWSLPEISLACAADVLDDLVDGDLDALLERQRVRAGGHVLQACADDRLGEHGRGRRAVAGDVVGRRGDLADELRALVLEDVLDLDLASDGHTIVRDRGSAELLVQDDVAAARAERHLDGVGDGVDAELERLARLDVVLQFLVSHVSLDLLRSSAGDLGEHVGLAQDQQVLAFDRDLGAAVLGVEDLVALDDVERLRWPLSSSLPSPTARTLPFCGFSLAVSGRTMPEAVVASSSTALTIRRSPSGLSFI